jgi:hypothetical protein
MFKQSRVELNRPLPRSPLWLIVVGTVVLNLGTACIGCEFEGQEADAIAEGVLAKHCRCEEGSVAPGTGEESFEGLSDGDDLVLVHGPQGGWHVEAALQTSNLLSIIQFEARLEDAEGRILTTPTFSRLEVDRPTPCVGEAWGYNLFIDPVVLSGATAPEALACTDARMTICAEDSVGRGGCTEVWVRIVPDSMDVDSGLVGPCLDP